MKYFKINGKNYHCSDIFNYAAVDRNGSIFVYENKPFARNGKGYWTGGYKSHDLCVAQNEGHCVNWVNTLICL